MELVCDNCNEPISADAIDVETMSTVCPNCGTRLDFSDALRRTLPPSPKPKVAPPPPKNFHVVETPDYLRIRYQWFSWRAPIFFMAGLALIGIPLTALSISGGYGLSIFWVLLVLFGLVAVFGVGLTYYSLAHFFNTTSILATSERLEIRHHPVRVPGNVRVNTDAIRAINAKTIHQQGGFEESYTYEVHADLKDDTTQVLVKGLSKREQADFIEQRICQYLKIEG